LFQVRTVTLVKFINPVKKKSLKRGSVFVYRGLTVHRKNKEGYKLRVNVQNDVEGINQYYNVSTELVAYHFKYGCKCMLLTATVNEQKNTIEVQIRKT